MSPGGGAEHLKFGSKTDNILKRYGYERRKKNNISKNVSNITAKPLRWVSLFVFGDWYCFCYYN